MAAAGCDRNDCDWVAKIPTGDCVEEALERFGAVPLAPGEARVDFCQNYVQMMEARGRQLFQVRYPCTTVAGEPITDCDGVNIAEFSDGPCPDFWLEGGDWVTIGVLP